MTTDLRCPSCGSLARPDAGWCSLCHEDLRSEEEKAAARAAQAVPEWEADAAAGPGDVEPTPSDTAAEVGPDAAAAVRALVMTAPRGKHARPGAAAAPSADAGSAAGPYDTVAAALAPLVPTLSAAPRSAVSTQADAALAEAGVDVQSMLELLAAAGGSDPLRPLTGRLESKGSRAIVVLVAATGLTAVALLVMFVVGSFLH